MDQSLDIRDMSQDPDPDGLYDKYRVYKEPHDVDEHPVPADGPRYTTNKTYAPGKPIEAYMEEVREFVFVLKPDSDPHARVAMAAYAESVQGEKPMLAEDLRSVLRDTRTTADILPVMPYYERDGSR